MSAHLREAWRKLSGPRAKRGGVLEWVPTQTVIQTYKFMDAISGTWEDIRAENLADAKSGSAQFSSWGLDPGEPSLYESIRDEGFWEAIFVFEYDNGERWVVDGHTRLSVAEDLGLPRVPIEVRHEKSTQPVKVVVEAADTPSHLPGWTAKHGIDAHGQMARLVSIGTSKVAHIAALDSYGDSFSEARRTGDLVTICDRYIRGGGWSSYGHYNAEDVDYVLNIAETKSFTSLCANCVRVAKANGIDLL